MSKPNMEKNNWRLEKGGARSVEIKMGKSQSCGDSKRAKRKKRKGRKECFESGMKMLLRIGEDSDQGGEFV